VNRAEPSTVQVRLNIPLDQLCRDLMAQRDECQITNSLLWEVVVAAREYVDGLSGCRDNVNARFDALCAALKRLEAL